MNIPKIEFISELSSRNVLKAGEKIQRDYESGQAQEVVFNKNMVALVRAAKVHKGYSLLHDGYFFIDSLQIIFQSGSACRVLDWGKGYQFETHCVVAMSKTLDTSANLS